MAMQKQMLSQMGSRVPFALGDAARAAMMKGEYNGNIYQDLADRAGTHLTAEKLANMDIDELTELAHMANGQEGTDGVSSGASLSDSQRQIINDRIDEVEGDDILKTKVAGRDRTQYDRIRGSGASPTSELEIPHGPSGSPSGVDSSLPTASSSSSSSSTAPSMPEEWRAWHEEQARRNNPNAADRGSTTDADGRATPTGATDDYHDGMSK